MTTTSFDANVATLAALRGMYADAKRDGTMDKRAVGDAVNSLGSDARHVAVREAFAALGWDGEANGADTYVCVSQNMFRVTYYSDLGGEKIADHGLGSADDGFYALSIKPWTLSVQERRGARGMWHQVYSRSFFTKEAALADAARQGIEVHYVSNHFRNEVRGRAFLPKAA